jgi:hypothetical protein
MHCGDEPKRVRIWLLGLFRFTRLQCRSPFSHAGKQTKPICFFSKGCSRLSWKARIERCFVVSGGNMGVLFWSKKHPCRMPLRQRFDVIHGGPSCWTPAESTKRYFRSLVPITGDFGSLAMLLALEASAPLPVTVLQLRDLRSNLGLSDATFLINLSNESHLPCAAVPIIMISSLPSQSWIKRCQERIGVFSVRPSPLSSPLSETRFFSSGRLLVLTPYIAEGRVWRRASF